MIDSTCYNVVTLAEIKNWLKIEHNSDDTLLNSLRISCIDYAERYTNLCFITRNIILDFSILEFKTSRYSPTYYIDIIKPPVICVVLVQSIIDDIYTKVPESYYSFKNTANIGRILFYTIPNFDVREAYPIRVYFVSGFGSTSDDVPELIKTAIKEHVAFLYENRGDVISEGSLGIPLETTMNLNKYKVRFIT